MSTICEVLNCGTRCTSYDPCIPDSPLGSESCTQIRPLYRCVPRSRHLFSYIIWFI